MARTFPNAGANRLKVGGNPSKLNFPGNGERFTLSAWIKLASNANEQTFLSKYNGAQGPLLRMISSKLRCFWIDSGVTGHEAVGATTITAAAWHHIAAVWSSAGMDVYLDGVNDGSDHTNTTLNTTSDTTDGWTFGARAAATFPLNGDMAEMAMWNLALTAGEVAALAGGVSPMLVAPHNLKGYWPTYSSTDSQIDLTASPSNLALVGTLASADHAPVGPPVMPQLVLPVAASVPGAETMYGSSWAVVG